MLNKLNLGKTNRVEIFGSKTCSLGCLRVKCIKIGIHATGNRCGRKTVPVAYFTVKEFNDGVVVLYVLLLVLMLILLNLFALWLIIKPRV